MKWEYKKIWKGSSIMDERELNYWGNEGWELCATLVIKNDPRCNSSDIHFIFKRLKDEVKEKGENRTA